MTSSPILKQAAITLMERGWKAGTVVHDANGKLYRLAEPPHTVRNLLKVDVTPLFETEVVTRNIGDFRILRIECKCGKVSPAKASNAQEPALSCSSCRRRYKRRVKSGWYSGNVGVTLLPTPMIGMKVWLQNREGVITDIENVNWVWFEFPYMKERHQLYRHMKGGEHWSCRRKRAWLIGHNWNG